MLRLLCLEAAAASGASPAALADPLASFGPENRATAIANAPLGHASHAASTSDCAASCLANAQCVSFNWRPKASDNCELSTWSTTYQAKADPAASYFFRQPARNDSRVTAAVTYQLQIPTGGVELVQGSPFAQAFDANIEYLMRTFSSADNLLYWFRARAGQKNPKGARSLGWDRSGPDQPYGLKGSIAGLFMMGSGGVLRWQNHSGLWQTLSAVLAGIAAAQEADGYMMAFPRNESFYHENPDYVASWVTHGLLEADVATGGKAGALQMFRKHFDWFNYN